MRVLTVDDNANNRYLLSTLLRGHGFEVEEAVDGGDALAKARVNRPDLVISDLLMPVVDGYTLLRQWKADESLATVPFMVYTATYTDARDEHLARTLGADAFVVKPAEPDALIAQIGTLLAGENRAGAVVAHPRAEALLHEYNEVLVRKLEKKVVELEQANLALREVMARRDAAERAAQSSGELLRAVAEGTPDALFAKDRDGRYLLANAAVAGFFGLAPEDVLGKDDNDVLPAEAAQLLRANDLMVMESNQTQFLEETFETARGERTFLVTKVPYRDRDGQVIGVLGLSRDITDRQRLEQQLAQAQKMEAVGRLAGGVAHDFNNLLSVIAGYCELVLAMPELDPGVREAVGAVNEAGQRATALTRQLLGFSRQSLLQPVVLDLNAAVAQTANMLRRLIGADIELVTTLDPALDRVKVDPGQLNQVLINLAVNARDAMPNGGQLVVETRNIRLEQNQTTAESVAGQYVVLTVRDCGCGMDKDVLARVFEPFFTTKDVGKGTGLGLPMVLGIVQQSGGHIEIDSQPNLGATFRIFFPAVAEEVARSPEPTKPREGFGRETILLVEDEDAVRRLAKRSLELHGYRVVDAADGRLAAEILGSSEAGPFGLVVTDVVMPNMGGTELARIVRARFPQLKILFTSGYSDDAVVRDGLADAAVNFIQKPYTPSELALKVREVLDDTARDRPAGR